MANNVAIHQPNYLPWLGYFHKMMNCDKFVFLDSVPFTKNGLQNRNRIKTAPGLSWLTVPVLRKGQFGQLTQDVKINKSVDWRRKHWNALCTNYRKAEYFKQYSGFLQGVYERQWVSLVDLNIALLKFIMEKLYINIPVYLASQLDCRGEGSDLLLDICRKLSADGYLSGPSGKEYLREEIFKDNGIEIKYHQFIHPVYAQLYGEFVPNLSVIDLLFNCGEKSRDIILGKDGL